MMCVLLFFFFSSRRRHTRSDRDWSSDVCSSDLVCLGLTGGQVRTRKGRVKVSHDRRTLANKESARWVTTAEQGCGVLAAARMVTVVNDREGDFFAHWALTPADNVHLLSRAMHDHALVDGG